MIAAALALVASVSVETAASEASVATDTAIMACEQWLLEPATWSEDVAGFARNSGLAIKGLTSIAQVPDMALPPPQTRRAMHHWRISMGKGGLYVTASDQLPVCHIVGGGPLDIQPGLEAELRSPKFQARWNRGPEERRGEMITTRYVYKADANLTMAFSRASVGSGRTDHAQVIATLQYANGN